jgi:hypothetical protein
MNKLLTIVAVVLLMISASLFVSGQKKRLLVSILTVRSGSPVNHRLNSRISVP